MLPFLGKQDVVRLCKLPMEKLVTMETHLASQQRLWNQRLEVPMQRMLQMMNQVRYRARATVLMAMRCQLHRMIYQDQFGGINAVMWCIGVRSQQGPLPVVGLYLRATLNCLRKALLPLCPWQIFGRGCFCWALPLLLFALLLCWRNAYLAGGSAFRLLWGFVCVFCFLFAVDLPCYMTTGVIVDFIKLLLHM